MPTIADTMALAFQLHQTGDLHRARDLYLRVLQTDPANADAYHLAGVVAFQLERPDLAVTLIGQALALRPGVAAYHCNLGLAQHGLGQWQGAVASFQEALRLEPDSADAHNGLGDTLRILGRIPEAETYSRQAVRLRPAFAAAHNNLANALALQGNSNEAQAHYEQALRLDPAFAKAHWNRSMLWLRLGNWEQGWSEYEWRWTQNGFIKRQFQQPLWDGANLDGRTILLHAEQGLGDTLQFIRYVALVRERGGNAIVECQPALQHLLAHYPGLAALVPRGAVLPPFDVHAPLLSLPGIFRTTIAKIPVEVPYLKARPDLVEHWRQQLEERGRRTVDPGPTSARSTPHAPRSTLCRVGIAWQGSPVNPDDRLRSIPLVHFARLAEVPGVTLISLQKGYDNPSSVTPHAPRSTLHAFATTFPELDESNGPFMDTAAIMRNLDLVVTADTAIGHLAGALGVPTWIVLPYIADWRWLMGRTDSPWYPTVRLFRQDRFGDWKGVFECLAAELAVAPNKRVNRPCHKPP